MLYMLDTDICIYIARQSNPKVMARFAKYGLGDLGISVVGYGELLVGTKRSSRSADGLKALNIFIQIVPVLPVNPEAGWVLCQNSIRSGTAGPDHWRQRSLDRLPLSSTWADACH